MARILIIDDEEPIRFSLRGILEDEGYEVLEAATAEEGLEVADAERPDLVFLDIWLPGMDGLTAQARLKGNHPDLPVVMISGHGTIETAVSAIQQGAYDFIEKPLSLEKVVIVAARALEAGSLRRENQVLRTVLPEQDELIGQSPVMLKFQELLARVAPTDVWVLLTGENGTGKELAARALHAGSRRADAPMIAVNCAAIPEELIESELFGHEKGAFTSADQARAGRFEMANNGTLFLDEIGELPMPMQTRLLRFLQDWEIMRVGSTTPKQIDVRIVAATNKNLERAIARGEFRSDLYYRLKVAVIAIPPLRDRQADILPLARMFLRFYGSKYHRQLTFSEEAESLLLDYKWPGNIRELENLVQGLAVTSKDSVIRASDVPISGVAKPAASVRRDGLDFELDGKTYKEIMKDLENKVLSAAMERYGSITEVARHFQVDRSTIFRKVKELEKEGKMR